MNTYKIFSRLLVISITLIISKGALSQISKGGTPLSFSITSLKDSIQTIKIPAIDLDSLILNDTIADFSFRFGYAIDIDMGLYNSGTWDTLQNGDKIWRLKISSPGAFSINLIFDDFWLPDGAEFFVYSEDKSMVLGAFTATLSNNNYYKFSTDLVKGEIIVLEYFEPAYASNGRLNVNKVIHGYINTFSGYGGSASCFEL